MISTIFDNESRRRMNVSDVGARVSVCLAIAFLGCAGTFTPASAAPLPSDDVDAICVAQMAALPILAETGIFTGRDTVSCTDSEGKPLISGTSEIASTAAGSQCADTVTTRWNDGTSTTTKTNGHTDIANKAFAATGQVSADSTRFANDTVTVVGSGAVPNCDDGPQAGVSVYVVTFRR
ncbi:hypothetical protein AB0H00_23560 [Nocardia sp. NPDC023852]|uniref:hypothetical protein n=1 Tax=Nocardia sp. NPDC023852 TaxID=3154697 RepID=UPI0033C67658